MSFTDVLIGGAIGFLTGGPVGAGIGAAAGAGLLDDVGGAPTAATTALAPLSNTSLTKTGAGTVSIPVLNEPTLLEKLGSLIGGGGATLAGAALAPGATQAVLAGGAGCPTGKNRVRTIIQVIKPNGQVCSQKIESGRPFLMAKDIVTAKRVFRTVAKVAGRLPRRTVKQSKAAMLTEAAVDRALRDVNNDNGNGGKC